jgi:excisionase family DNA binding protein
MTTLLDESEAARLLSLTPRQVVRLANRGELPTVHLPGGQIRFDPDDLSRWVESHKRPGANVEGPQAATPAAESPSARRAEE